MLDGDLSTSIWTNPERTRFFIIPDEAALPTGDFGIRTITGRHQQVDAAVLSRFEISEAEAKEWLKSEFGKILESTRKAADRLVENIRARTAALDNGTRRPRKP